MGSREQLEKVSVRASPRTGEYEHNIHAFGGSVLASKGLQHASLPFWQEAANAT